jgi:ribonuclease HII
MMTRAARHFPDYGFDRHMGYGTPGHLAALRSFGACILHRATFAPVRALFAKEDAAGSADGVELLEAMLSEEA